jgi:hypothetical protein
MLDKGFPSLASLAASHGYSLANLADEADLTDDMKPLTLRECCHLHRSSRTVPGMIPWEAYYLRTVDAFIGSMSPRKNVLHRVWRKISAAASTEFLDTVAEAAWYLAFVAAGVQPLVEEPFDAADRSAGNADLVITHERRTYWLDAYSVQPSQLEPPNEYGFVPSSRTAASFLAGRARGKYNKKFRRHVEAGRLKGRR